MEAKAYLEIAAMQGSRDAVKNLRDLGHQSNDLSEPQSIDRACVGPADLTTFPTCELTTVGHEDVYIDSPTLGEPSDYHHDHVRGCLPSSRESACVLGCALFDFGFS